MIMLKHAMVQKMQIEAIPHSNHEMTSGQKFSFRPPLAAKDEMLKMTTSASDPLF